MRVRSEARLEKTVARAAYEQGAMAGDSQARFGFLLGIHAHQLQPVGRDVGDEDDEMILVHRVVEMHVVFAVDVLDLRAVGIIRLPRRNERLEWLAAAGKLRCAGGGQDVSAGWTAVKFQMSYVSHLRGVAGTLACNQVVGRDAERARDRSDKRDVRASGAPLPFRDGAIAHANHLAELALGEPTLVPHLRDQGAGQSRIHIRRLLLWRSEACLF